MEKGIKTVNKAFLKWLLVVNNLIENVLRIVSNSRIIALLNVIQRCDLSEPQLNRSPVICQPLGIIL